MQAAGQLLVLRVMARILDTDPEIADEYLFKYTKKWGKKRFHNLIAFLQAAEENAIPDDIARKTLENDISYLGDNPEKLMIPEAKEGL